MTEQRREPPMTEPRNVPDFVKKAWEDLLADLIVETAEYDDGHILVKQLVQKAIDEHKAWHLREVNNLIKTEVALMGVSTNDDPPIHHPV